MMIPSKWEAVQKGGYWIVQTEDGVAVASIENNKDAEAHARLIASSPYLAEALKAAQALAKKNIHATVANIHTIKPINQEQILDIAKKTHALVTVEEHSIIGGLGSAVAESLSQTLPTPMEFVGTKDCFGESGKPDELLEKYHLTAHDIENAALKVLKRK